MSRSQRARIYDPALRIARLLYQCVAVAERSSDRAFRPVVDEGTLEEVTINGQPGYYYTSMAVSPSTGRRQPTPQLVFERDGTIITLSALPQDPSPSRSGTLLGKTDLIRIAESMTRVHSP